MVDKPPQALGHPWLLGSEGFTLCHGTAQTPVIQPSSSGSRAVCVHCCSLLEPNPASWAFPFYLCEQKSRYDSTCEMPGHTFCHTGALDQGILSNICVQAAEQPCWVPLRAQNEIYCRNLKGELAYSPQELNPLLY